MGNHMCVVCEYGWIICGVKTSESDFAITLNDSAVVRSWSNGRGIGGIVKAKYKDEYALDEIGTLDIQKSKILFEIPCEW